MPIDIETLGLIPGEPEAYLLCRTLLDEAKKFYQDPKNVKAYKAWLKKKKEEEKKNAGCDDHD